MGFYNALNACFTLHELNHSHWAQVHEGYHQCGVARITELAGLLPRGPSTSTSRARRTVYRHLAGQVHDS